MSLFLAHLKLLLSFGYSHWSVFLSGMVTIIIFWGLSPLQSAIFTTRLVENTSTRAGNLHGGLPSVTENAAGMNLSFIPSAYGVVWLNQSLPPFTSLDAAYVPFSVNEDSNGDSSSDISSNKTLTSKTSMLSTSIECAPASVYNSSLLEPNISRRSGLLPTYIIDDHFGCRVNLSGYGDQSDYYFRYIGYQASSWSSGSLQELGCPLNASSLYLAVVEAPNLEHIISEFCQPSYWIQDVNLTVTESDMAVVSSTPLAPPSQLRYDDFNSTEFQVIIWTGQLSGDFWRMDEANGDLIDFEDFIVMDSRLRSLNINLEGSYMAGFAVGMTRFPAQAYMERENLISSLEKAHRLLFALATNGLLTMARNESGTVTIAVTGSVYGISVVRPLAIAIEALLGCSIVGILLLLFVTTRRPSCLAKDPASLSVIASMLDSASEDSEDANLPSVVIHESNGVEYSLRQFRRHDGPQELFRGSNELSGRIVRSEIFARPFYLGPITGFVFVFFLLGLIGGLVTLKILIDRHNGLQLPSQSDVVTQIVLSYVPVLFSTFLEPYWVLLNRMLCLLQPFEELKTCRAKAKQSLDLRYSSLPPSLALWRALRAKHYLLAAVCSISLLANVLTVGLGALLNPDPTLLITNTNLKTKSKPIFNSDAWEFTSDESDYQDFLYVAQSSLSSNTTLPPWTSKDTYFLPMVLDIEIQADVTVNTYGFHVALSCNEVAVNNDVYNVQNSTFSFNTTIIQPDGGSVDCYFDEIIESVESSHMVRHEGFETVAPLLASNPNASIDEVATCSSALSVVYQRGDGTSYSTGVFNSTSSLYLICNPALDISNYSVQLSQLGFVVSSVRQTRQSEDMSDFFARPLNVSSLYSNLNQLIPWVQKLGGGQPRYTNGIGGAARLHNDAFAYS